MSFQQSDISYPGIGPTITLSRSYSIGGATAHGYGFDAFGDWALSIPRIETILPGDRFSDFGEWKTLDGSYSRCSGFGAVSPAPYATFAMRWWNGYQLVTPDGASQSMLGRGAENTLKPSSGTYNIVTGSNWMIGCIPISNPGPSGVQGEGFLALAPDGTRYWFDYMVYGPPIQELLYEAHTPIQHLPRKMGYLYVSKIRDRFGNQIDYHYDANQKLYEISGSDGRQVTIAWRVDGKVISSITVQPGPTAQTWTYGYASSTSTTLTSVDLPDHAKWLFTMNGADRMDMLPDSQGCGGDSSVPTSPPTTLAITHPSGLVGTFNVDYHVFGRSLVPNVCNPATLDSPAYDSIPPYYLAVALNSKSISGPGVTSQTWTYTYGTNASGNPNCAVTGCVTSSWVEVGAPDGSWTRYTHSAEWGPYEGKLLSVVAGKTAALPAGLKNETHEYAATTLGPFPTRIGYVPSRDYAINDAPLEYLAPETKATTSLQGVTFTRTINQFDKYARATSVTRSSIGGSGGNFSRTEASDYDNNESLWVLGQLKSVTQSGVVTSQTDYDATTSLPIRRYGFGGVLQQSLTYNADGTLATVKDGNNNIVTLGSWYRGVPRLIGLPTGFSISATVDAAGKLLTTTDELTSTTGYGYDAMGRLSAINYPSGDSVAWNALARGFVPVASAEYGIPAGHWRQTVQTGNGQATTYYDARWQPVLTLTEDTANASSRSFVVRRFDGIGRLVFTSYPVGSATVSDALPGTATTYDSLGRPVQVKQDSELGVLTATTEYLTGFQTRVTNPRGNATTTSYQVFDTPSMDAPIRIDAPLGVTTVITRSEFGVPLSITRSGPGG